MYAINTAAMRKRVSSMVAAILTRGAANKALQEKGRAGCLIWEGSLPRLQEKGGAGSPYLRGEPFSP